MRQGHCVILLLSAQKNHQNKPFPHPIHRLSFPKSSLKTFSLKSDREMDYFLINYFNLFTQCCFFFFFSLKIILVSHRIVLNVQSKMCFYFMYLLHFFLLQEIQATWYEKLHEWEDALVAYDKKIDMNKGDPELILGRMRCLEALGEW